eukprot:gnl/Carplike_NY0171/6831_a9401_246.p1 GENE.gnl/Carplike_NY0171/6831_a9401_246~~gnl/Carplike_NY0171/6831_a9401_246.p1  ORF type:complete len:152 (-),score=43.12 gnl/Carplike_NY0171/6831_a9401_246:77-532(-)
MLPPTREEEREEEVDTTRSTANAATAPMRTSSSEASMSINRYDYEKQRGIGGGVDDDGVDGDSGYDLHGGLKERVQREIEEKKRIQMREKRRKQQEKKKGSSSPKSPKSPKSSSSKSKYQKYGPSMSPSPRSGILGGDEADIRKSIQSLFM